MLKKLLNLWLLGLIFLFATSVVAYAQPDSNNPFTVIDKEYEERLNTVKDKLEDNSYLQKSLSSEEQYQREKSALQSSINRYIVKFKENSSMKQIFDIVSLYNYKILGKSENRLFVIELTDIQIFEQQSADIIEFIEEDMKKEANIIPSDSYYPYQWGLKAMNIPEAWEISKGSNSVYVAVIDSGIYRDHPDLVNTDIRNGWDYILDEFCEWDSTGHGTSVTGIIGAETNNYKGIAGVNWNVAIIPLKVASFDGSIYVADTIQAIFDAADLNCDVINLSLGGSVYSSAENIAVSYAVSKGSIVVASAGNDGNGEYKFPASYDGVISVGSIDSKLQVSDFSQHNNKVDVTAPGEDIYSTADWYYQIDYSDYAFVDGTSFSAPYVSGIAALMSAVKPSITAEEFMDILKVTSTDLGYPGYDNYYGYGLINAEKMLRKVAKIQVQSVSLNKNSMSLKVGDSEKITSMISPSNATNQIVTWKSNNPLVATVKNGLVTAIAEGETVITVTTEDGNHTAICKVIVGKSINWESWEPKYDIASNKVWTIEFNKVLDISLIKENNIYVTDNKNQIVQTLCNTSQDKFIYIAPINEYQSGYTYTLWIRDLKANDGSLLNKNIKMEFTIK